MLYTPDIYTSHSDFRVCDIFNKKFDFLKDYKSFFWLSENTLGSEKGVPFQEFLIRDGEFVETNIFMTKQQFNAKTGIENLEAII